MAHDDAYSPLKAVRHLDIVQAVRDGRPARPAHVQIILSDLCNQSCNFCAYRTPTYSSSQLFYEIKPDGAGLRRDSDHPERNFNPNRMIPHDKAIEILYDCQAMGVSGVQFTGGGEPTVHPEFLSILAAAQTLGLATSLVTNGVVIGKKWSAWDSALNDLKWIRFSVDAGSAQTYARVRNVPEWHFDAVCTAIQKVRASRDERAGKGPVIGVGFVVTPDNWTEIWRATKLAKDLGADNIRISAQFSPEDERLFADFHQLAAVIAKRAESFTDKTFTVFNRFGEKLEDLRQRAPDYERCGYQSFTTYIGGDLSVYRCCLLAYNERGVVGSLKNQSFKELWMKQGRADDMASFKASDCVRCQFNGINRTINYMCRPEDPEHSAFV